MENILPQVKKIHLVGIGGSGMSGLALLLKESGYVVTGSDTGESVYLKPVRACGVPVMHGHCPGHIGDIDLLCYSSAIREDNVELQEARRRGIPVIKRGALLGELSRGKKVVAVSGSHGKTTTSALIAFLLHACGYRPTTFIGAQPFNYDRQAWLGDEDIFVAEADESDGSFLYYSPWVSIVTNIDREHLDFYGTQEELIKSFSEFLSSAKELAIGWGDSPLTASLLEHIPSLTFGIKAHNHVRAENIFYDGTGMVFDLIIAQRRYDGVKVSLLGEHNVLNVLAAVTFLSHAGADMDKAVQALPGFRGTNRRFQVKKRTGGVMFVDDYAHHPTEIDATLRAARLLKPGRIVAVFQPHRFSRARALSGEFSRCFSECDHLFITDVYAAGEKRPGDFDEQAFRDGIKKGFGGQCRYVCREEVAQQVAGLLQKDDIVVFLGAGDINKLGDEVVRMFEGSRDTEQLPT